MEININEWMKNNPQLKMVMVMVGNLLEMVENCFLKMLTLTTPCEVKTREPTKLHCH
jgi:hypothetical protein